MNDLMQAGETVEQTDPQGSLIDADMGAYYVWINLMRLPGAASARFLAWFEGQRDAIAIAPCMAQGTLSNQNCNVEKILRWMS
jgi:hypothetical protein